MRYACAFMMVSLLVLVRADLSKERVNADIGQLMSEQKYDNVEAYIATNRIEALSTNLVFQGLLNARRGKAKEAIDYLERYLEEAKNRSKAFEEVIRVGNELPEVSRHLREFGVAKYGLKLPPDVEVETTLEQVLGGEDVDQMIIGLESHHSLIAQNPKAAYNEIRTTSLRHLSLAATPKRSANSPEDQILRHGNISETLYRYLEKVDASAYASIEGQCQLAAILQVRGKFGPALQILTALRELKGPELDARQGQLDLLSAVCLEESGMVGRAKHLYEKIVSKRSAPQYAGYAEAAQDRLTAMHVLETRTNAAAGPRKGKMGLFFGVSALAALGSAVILLIYRRDSQSGRIAAGLLLVLGLASDLTGSEAQAAATVVGNDPSSPAAASSTFLTNRVDMGTVKGRLTKFNWRPVIDAPDTVSRVRTSCGCTAVGVKDGEQLVPNQAIPMEIRLSGKPGGHHEESVLLELSSGKSMILQFVFTYEPAPFVSDKYILFWPGSYTRTVMVRTFGVPKVAFRNLSTNGPVSVRRSRDTEDGIELELTWKQSAKQAITKGMVDVEIVASDRYTNSIPFAVLSAAP